MSFYSKTWIFDYLTTDPVAKHFPSFSFENKSQPKVEVIEKASKKHQEKEMQSENLDDSTTA